MKKFIVCFIILLVFVEYSIAGDPVTLPYNVVISDPLTDQADRIHIRFYWDATGAHCEFRYALWNQARTKIIEEYSFIIDGQDLIDFTAGYAATLQSRANTLMSDHLQTERTTQAK